MRLMTQAINFFLVLFEFTAVPVGRKQANEETKQTRFPIPESRTAELSLRHGETTQEMFFLAVGVPGDNGLGVARVFRDRLRLPDRLREPRAGVVQGALSLLLASFQERGHHVLCVHDRRNSL